MIKTIPSNETSYNSALLQKSFWGFPSRSDTNRDVKLQRVDSFGFRRGRVVVVVLYLHLYIVNKGDDLRCAYVKSRFSHDAAKFIII